MKKIIGMFLVVGMFGSISMATEMPSALETFGIVAGEQDSISIPAPILTKSLSGINVQHLTVNQINEELALRHKLTEVLHYRWVDLVKFNASSEDIAKGRALRKAINNIEGEIEQLRAMLRNNETVVPSIYQVAEMKAEIPNLKRKIAILETEFDSAVDQYASDSSLVSSEQVKRIVKILEEINDAKSRINYIEAWLL